MVQTCHILLYCITRYVITDIELTLSFVNLTRVHTNQGGSPTKEYQVKRVTVAELQKRADQIKKDLKAGKFRGTKKAKMQTKYYNTLRNMKLKIKKEKRAKPASMKELKEGMGPQLAAVISAVEASGGTQAAPQAQKRGKSKPVDFKQGFLPGFLTQERTARIEEMVADRLFRAVATKLGLELEEETSDVG